MSHDGKMSRGLRFSKMINPQTGELIDACKKNLRIMETINYYKEHSKNSKKEKNKPIKEQLKPEEPKEEEKKAG